MTNTLVREIVGKTFKPLSGVAYPASGEGLSFGKGGFMGSVNKGRPVGTVGNVLEQPKFMHGVGCGFSERIGGVGRQTLVCYITPIDAKPIKTYPAGRKCQICGCNLSIYNPNNKCTCHTNLHLTR